MSSQWNIANTGPYTIRPFVIVYDTSAGLAVQAKLTQALLYMVLLMQLPACAVKLHWQREIDGLQKLTIQEVGMYVCVFCVCVCVRACVCVCNVHACTYTYVRT